MLIKVQVYLHLKPDTCSLQHTKGKILQNWGKALLESAKCIILKSASYILLLLQMHTAESAFYHTAWHAAYLCFLKAFCFTAVVHKVNHKSALLCSGGENKRGDLNGKMWKYFTTAWERGLIFFAFLLLATGTRTDKVPSTPANGTHSPPPLWEALSFITRQRNVI